MNATNLVAFAVIKIVLDKFLTVVPVQCHCFLLTASWSLIAEFSRFGAFFPLMDSFPAKCTNFRP